MQKFYEWHNLQYMESSAKTNKNIREIFFTITQEIYKAVVSGDIVLDNTKPDVLSNQSSQNTKSGCSC